MGDSFLPPVVHDPNDDRRNARLMQINRDFRAREFSRRRSGMIHAMDGGFWLHRHVWKGVSMVHFVSTNKERLLEYGSSLGLDASRLQFKPLKDPRTGVRRDAWHWDLGGPVLPPQDASLFVQEL